MDDIHDTDRLSDPSQIVDGPLAEEAMNKIRVYDRPERPVWRVLLLLLLIIAVLATLSWVAIQALQ